MKKYFLLIAIFLWLLPAVSLAQEAVAQENEDGQEMQVQGTYEGEVTKVINGTIFEINGEHFRLLGIDAPKPTKCPKEVTCRADEAKKFLEDKIMGRTVTYDYDRMLGRRDKRGIRRIYLYLDGELINATMIEQGNSFVDRSRSFEKKELFLAMEDLARRRSMGLWHQCPVECSRGTVCRTKSW